MITSRPSSPILLECLLIGSQCSLPELEFIAPITELWNVLLGGSLESVLLLELTLEVQPVLACIVKWLLYQER